MTELGKIDQNFQLPYFTNSKAPVTGLLFRCQRWLGNPEILFCWRKAIFPEKRPSSLKATLFDQWCERGNFSTNSSFSTQGRENWEWYRSRSEIDLKLRWLARDLVLAARFIEFDFIWWIKITIHKSWKIKAVNFLSKIPPFWFGGEVSPLRRDMADEMVIWIWNSQETLDKSMEASAQQLIRYVSRQISDRKWFPTLIPIPGMLYSETSLFPTQVATTARSDGF